MSEETKAGAFRAYWSQKFPWLTERWGDSYESHYTVCVRFLDTAADYLDQLGAAPAEVSDKREDRTVADEEKTHILESTRISDENKATSEYLRDMIGG